MNSFMEGEYFLVETFAAIPAVHADSTLVCIQR